MERELLAATIASAKAGSSEAYQSLLDAYGRRLYGYFFQATRSHHDAEDLLGELMLRLVKRLGYYDERGRFDQWLFRIAANMVRDRIRKIQARPNVGSLSGGCNTGESRPDPPAAKTDPVDAELLGEEAFAELNAALAKLDAKTRETLLLRHFGEMSFREIAENLQCPIGTVLARVHRGLRTLRHILGDGNGHE